MTGYVVGSVPPKIAKPAQLTLLRKVDIAALAAVVAKLPIEHWLFEDARKDNKFNAFHSTQHIVMRFNASLEDPRDFTTKPAWLFWAKLITPIMLEIAQYYGYDMPEFPKVMLAKLQAGKDIDRHVDGAVYNHYVHKIHVPIISDPQVLFHEGDHAYYLAPGNAYEVNNLMPHKVENRSRIDRIHLIFELYNSVG